MIRDSIENVRQRMAAAAVRAGRRPEDVTLIAVSKTNPAEAVLEAAACGQTEFGENKAQEMAAKMDQTPDNLHWHFIGNLQRNKVKYVVGRAVLIHSVNSLELAQEIERLSAKRGLISKILIEVNIASEETKHGLDADAAEALVRAVSAMEHIEIDGLVAIAPPTEDPEDNRKYFREMFRLREKLQALRLPRAPLRELSMGMTGDFEVAVEEGATFIRVGTAIFGKRNYQV